jgi:phosphopantothenoylcysteine decarboxylase/phosphopantothenate--cysteine ligase
MGTLTEKRILLGVTGGIAAYKSAELVRRLRDDGADVRVVMTAGARQFITALTLQALSGNPVRSELLDADQEQAMGHIALARWADLVLVAPASADFMARLAHGRADDLLSALCLAADVPLLVAPAMNVEMWNNLATRANAELLRGRGITLLGPASGAQACGETGLGRMLEAAQLLDALRTHFQGDRLSGLNVLVTAGPTREPIDPVRFLSNRSSGRMGYAVARAASEAGAAVTLVSGPVALPVPEHVRHIAVDSALQMHDAVLADVADTDIFIAAAAVADYRCATPAAHKLKKRDAVLALELVRTPDILATVAALARPPFTVGFAAETEALRANAQQKLRDKKLDMIAANQVGPGLGIDTEDNELQVYWDDGSRTLERASKEQLARRLIALVADRFHARYPVQSH